MTPARPRSEETGGLTDELQRPKPELDPAHRQLDVLALLADPTPMRPLLAQLREQGFHVDAVRGLDQARASFYEAGGHDCLVVGPDVAPGLAERVASSLSRVYPGVAIATFGPEIGRDTPSRQAHLGGYHPGSRAGQGALLRFLRGL